MLIETKQPKKKKEVNYNLHWHYIIGGNQNL